MRSLFGVKESLKRVILNVMSTLSTENGGTKTKSIVIVAETMIEIEVVSKTLVLTAKNGAIAQRVEEVQVQKEGVIII